MDAELKHLADLDGIVMRRDILAGGGTDRMIQGALRAGSIVRVRNGSYALREVWDSFDARQRHMARARVTYRASRTDVVLSHVSAAVFHGAPLWRVSLDDVHLTRTDGRCGRKEAGVAQHRGRIGPDEVVQIDGLRVASPARTALELHTLLGMDRSVPVLDHFLHKKMTTKAKLIKNAAQMTHWPHSVSMDLAITFADGRRESIGESRTALVLRGNGRPLPQPQYKVYDSFGNVLARVDFAWPELGVFLEFDGKVKYQKLLKEGEDATDVVLREKKREELICRLTGWRCIRLTWSDLATPAITRLYVTSVLDGGPVHV